MRINCTKSEVPIGVRGHMNEDRGWVLCPDSDGNREDFKQCLNCPHYLGIHEVQHSTEHSKEKEKNTVVATEKEVNNYLNDEAKWIDDEMDLCGHTVKEKKEGG